LPATAHNCPAQTRIPATDPKRQGQITIAGIDYRLIDITEVPEAREYVMALGYLQAPVVVVGNEHWCGFRPDRINALASSAA
jgi:glutaredoxin-like protein NrdH